MLAPVRERSELLIVRCHGTAQSVSCQARFLCYFFHRFNCRRTTFLIILRHAEYYQIDADRCTECIGHYDRSTCQHVCPIDHTIIADPQRVKNSDTLWEKFVLLHHADRL